MNNVHGRQHKDIHTYIYGRPVEIMEVQKS